MTFKIFKEVSGLPWASDVCECQRVPALLQLRGTARHCTALGAARAKRSGLLETDRLAVGAAGEAGEAGDADAVTGFKRRGSATTSPRKRRTAGTKIIPCNLILEG